MEPDELDRILKLFQCHSNDAELHLRHLAAIDKLSKGTGSGFSVRDLPRVTQILGCTLDLVLSQHAQAFLDPACSLIRCECGVHVPMGAAAHQPASRHACSTQFCAHALPLSVTGL